MAWNGRCSMLSSQHFHPLNQPHCLCRWALQDATNTSETAYSHDLTWNSLFHHQPMQHHHNGYKFMLSKQQRQRGVSHYGSAERLRAALSRAITSKPI